MTKPISHRIAGDFTGPTVCGLPKEEWGYATTEWDWTNCPACLEQRPARTTCAWNNVDAIDFDGCNGCPGCQVIQAISAEK